MSLQITEGRIVSKINTLKSAELEFPDESVAVIVIVAIGASTQEKVS